MDFVTANWKAPKHVHALTTTRFGGVSQGVFAALNVGDHVSDLELDVRKNRELLSSSLKLSREPQWLSQVHGIELVQAQDDAVRREADACWTDEKGLACIVMTADCLPVFFSDSAGSKVAVAHAGWRGLLNGVLENTLSLYPDPSDVHVWFGPAIGPDAFEVGAEVREQFCDNSREASEAFKPVDSTHNKYLANIYELAAMRLRSQGVVNVSSSDLCTYSDSERFYSYRRDGQTGRLASLIWIE
jgi:YfiH family protein